MTTAMDTQRATGDRVSVNLTRGVRADLWSWGEAAAGEDPTQADDVAALLTGRKAASVSRHLAVDLLDQCEYAAECLPDNGREYGALARAYRLNATRLRATLEWSTA